LLSLLAHLTYSDIISITPNEACDTFSGTSSNSSIDPKSLDTVLSELMNNDVMFLPCGYYTLYNFKILSNVSNVSIIGDSDYPGKVVINCTEGVGFFIFNVRNLSISGITFQHCGLSGENSEEALHMIENNVELLYIPPHDFSTAILLIYVVGLHVEDVRIQNSTGFGLIGINLVGEVSFHRVLAAGNYPSHCAIEGMSTNLHEGSGGGMFFLYQDFISTTLDEDNHHDFVVSSLRTNFSMTESVISDNFACRLDPFNILYEKLQASIQHPIVSILPLAGAGGLSIALIQSSYQVTAVLDSCLFHNNSGTYNGEAMQIIMHESVNNSHVAVYNSVFHHNGEHLYNMFGSKGLGPVGSILVRFYMPTPRQDLGGQSEEEDHHDDESHEDHTSQLVSQLPCSVTISGCLFNNNTAKYGGAISVFSFRPYVRLVQDRLKIMNSTFLFNQADFGGAIYMSAFSYSAFVPGLNVTLHDINATRNMKRNLSVGSSLQIRSGIIDVNYFRVTFSGKNFITYNLDTGMSLRGAILEIWGQALWHHNLGTSGGALSLIDYSYIVLMEPVVDYTFSENSAVVAGGGVFVDYGESRGALYDCFFFFERIDFYCNILNSCARSLANYSRAKFQFINNTAPLGNAAYGGFNLECPWALSLQDRLNINGSSREVVSSFFHALGIKFYPPVTEKNTVNTLASSILANSSSPLYFEVLPGEEFNVVLGAFDKLNQVVPLTIFSSVALKIEDAFIHAINFTRDPMSSIGATNRYLLTDNQTYTVVPIQVFGLQNMTYSISIVSNEAPVEYLITVKLKSCPNGYVYDPPNQACRCDIDNYFDVECTNFGTIKTHGPWVGLVDDKYAEAHCVIDYCNASVREITLDNPDIQCMNNRSGTLCGQCKKGLSRVLGTYNCLVCSSYNLLLIIPVFALIGLALEVIITIFNITITIGYINGLIFYCNIMTIYLSTPSPAFDVGMFRVPIILPNLQLGIESCFYDGMRDIHSAFINFLFPVYLLFILVLITVIIKYMNSKRLVKLVSKINLTHVFSTLILLSFTSIMRSCIDALSFKRVAVRDTIVTRWMIDPNQVYFGGPHIALVLLSLILLFVFLLPLLIVLIFPKFFLKYSRMKPLVDAFIAPLKQEYLFWVGVRLFCRILFLLLSLIEEQYRFPVLAVLIALLTIIEAYIKPFKESSQNILDLSIMFNLVLFSTLAIANLYYGISNGLDIVATIFITVFMIQFNLTLIYHILVAIPPVKLCIEKKMSEIQEKVSKLYKWKRKEKARTILRVLSKRGTTERVFESTTHGSLRMDPVVGEEGDFQPAMCIRYRESMFENNSNDSSR